MKRNRILLFVLFTSIIIFSGCEVTPAPIRGCTDSHSINYNKFAEEDDGSCQYEGSVTFWYGEYTARTLVRDGVVNLYFYLDGILIGSIASSTYFISVPVCGNEGAISATRNLGSNTSKSFIYKVEDSDGNILWTRTITLFASQECLKLELTI